MADGDFCPGSCNFRRRTAAGLFITSGTTADRKGRAVFAPVEIASCHGRDSARQCSILSSARPLMPVVPLFHPIGCRQRSRADVRLLDDMPGAGMDGASIYGS